MMKTGISSKSSSWTLKDALLEKFGDIDSVGRPTSICRGSCSKTLEIRFVHEGLESYPAISCKRTTGTLSKIEF
eukprot:11456239-Karenia_brevis.AAC.1